MRKLFLSALATASIAGLALFVSAFSTVPSAASVLQTSNDATGNQAYSSVGLEFEVNSPITVYALGIYDSGQNGIAGSLTADLMTLTGTIKASATFSGTYALIGNYQFQSITPVTLSPGDYYLSGYGWTSTDPEQNCTYPGGGLCPTFVTSSLVTSVLSVYGGGFDPPGTLPTNSYPGDVFDSANIEFTAATPVPAALPLFATGLGAMGLFGWRRKRKSAAAIACRET